MSLSIEEVKQIAWLARIGIDDGAAAKYAHDLSGILDFVAQMNAVDTESVEPMAHPLDLPQRLRPDEVTEPNQREKFQAVAPAVANGLYLVPKVID
ncbi:aspartyl-tRNA(Asn)/glutamyl-tRNA(Gln) amidotransferase subunit C [Methylomarinovum caldicuralii]|uniref:Aspartyl/glutamyl-tRNA(Asn/Gln) amidotransferase subunit C n=1 Tax=Methylomarinovum caldicuralii TaxID=438856 RepID=A0AAU9C107_9GAMM|nr:Asp-tRNA(Asn)/Glu-tRNA(Gln) amidotransferase subunit GatC [Methylomarinovum caldicuralii]BCX80754.1 aspartyl-tRNA(Asn)/glutamyl-tRNA(Gln) amidotransferase subunit C [Methylomarinovum caldicuralii]